MKRITENALIPANGLINGAYHSLWREAGVEDKIELRLGPALATLDTLIAEGQGGSFDFAFIDADKANYANYYDRAMVLVRPGGLIAIDNVLWSGDVIDASKTDADTEAIRAFNRKLHADVRVFLDEGQLAEGADLAEKAREARMADIVLVLFSRNSLASRWPRAQWEDALVKEPAAEGVRIAFLKCDDCIPPRVLTPMFDAARLRDVKRWVRGSEAGEPPAAEFSAGLEVLGIATVSYTHLT